MRMELVGFSSLGLVGARGVLWGVETVWTRRWGSSCCGGVSVQAVRGAWWKGGTVWRRARHSMSRWALKGSGGLGASWRQGMQLFVSHTGTSA